MGSGVEDGGREIRGVNRQGEGLGGHGEGF